MKRLLVTTLILCSLPLVPTRLLAHAEIDTHLLLKPSSKAIHVETDPADEQACLSMGRMLIEYSTGDAGAPRVGFRMIDPLGRKIGYDPRTSTAWQEMPLAQAYLNCEENEDTRELANCAGHIEICGPLSGSYRIELAPTQSASYMIKVLAFSQTTRTGSAYGETTSVADLQGTISGKEPTVLLLHYSREPGTRVELAGSNQHMAGS
jgi:hypothetical protein